MVTIAVSIIFGLWKATQGSFGIRVEADLGSEGQIARDARNPRGQSECKIPLVKCSTLAVARDVFYHYEAISRPP